MSGDEMSVIPVSNRTRQRLEAFADGLGGSFAVMVDQVCRSCGHDQRPGDPDCAVCGGSGVVWSTSGAFVVRCGACRQPIGEE